MNSRKCKILELPKMTDPRGNLSFVEGSRHIPFEIQRIFYLYDVPSGATRAGHALRKQVAHPLDGCRGFPRPCGTGDEEFKVKGRFNNLTLKQ